jgi:predicted nucleic-acid-binding protein
VRAFDTNVLVRYLVRDDPDQAAIVDRVVSEVVASREMVFLDTVVLCETVWVLESGYRYGRSTIADVLDKLLRTQQFEIDRRDVVWRALRRFSRGKADFADYLIGENSTSRGCTSTCTFDRALRGEEGFELL